MREVRSVSVRIQVMARQKRIKVTPSEAAESDREDNKLIHLATVIHNKRVQETLEGKRMPYPCLDRELGVAHEARFQLYAETGGYSPIDHILFKRAGFTCPVLVALA